VALSLFLEKLIKFSIVLRMSARAEGAGASASSASASNAGATAGSQLKPKIDKFCREISHNFEVTYQDYWQALQSNTLDFLAQQQVNELIDNNSPATLEINANDPEILFWQIRWKLANDLLAIPK